jgi:hypothetical protein
MGDELKITVIATGFSQNGQEKPHAGSGSNVVPLSAGPATSPRVAGIDGAASEKSIDYRLASLKDNLDEPAFRRRRAD